MLSTTLSSREFNQDVGRAKRAAEEGPVIITDRGRPAFVLVTYAEYEKSGRKTLSGLEALAMPEEDDIEIELPEGGFYARPVDFD